MTRRKPQILLFAISLTLSGASLWRYAMAQPNDVKNASILTRFYEHPKDSAFDQRSGMADDDQKFSKRPVLKYANFGGMSFDDDPLGFEEIRLGIAIDRMTNAEGSDPRY